MISFSDIISGNFWLGFSKDEAVGAGIYRVTVGKYSPAGIGTLLLTAGKQYTVNGYTFDVAKIDVTADDKVLLTLDIKSTPEKNQQAGALAWGIILGGIGAALVLNSIEKIEKLVDTTTTRTIQIGVIAIIILLIWKFAKRQ
jgi:hypothetical protein